MGYYTELKFIAILRQDTPSEVVDLLDRVIRKGDFGVDSVLFKSDDVFKPAIEHPFFKCERWYMLFTSTNWDEKMQGGLFYKRRNNWVIDLHTEFKNYDDEIDEFIDWISPYVSGRKKKQYAGYYKGETQENKMNIYIK